MNIKTKQSGFTIVELLIVVVVIAILAAITLVSFNNITNRANQSAAKETASNVQKKVELYNAEKSVYPTQAQLTDSTGTNPSQAWFTASNLFAATVDASNGKGAVQYSTCGTSPNFTGAKITYWAYGATDGTNTNETGYTAGTAKMITLGTGC